MSGSIHRVRSRLAQRQHSKGLQHGTHQAKADHPVQLIQAHCDEFIYLRIEPPTANGVIKLTREQFESSLEAGVKVLESFNKRQDEIKAGKK